MWVISGPFDGTEKNEVGFKKAKLLKTGTRYSLGRKERQLTVNHAKVSHDHGAITVASYSQDDVADPLTRPSLSVHNAGKKTMTVNRGDEVVHVIPSSTEELQDGDTIDIVVGVSLSVQWRQVCCLAQPNRGKSFISLDACASLGISIVYVSHPSVTHHLISQFLANHLITTSLLSAAQFVKPEWLNELIRVGNLPINGNPSNGSSLEQVFALPAETKFRPAFAAALPSSLKVFKAWEPNEERINMFRGCRFLFVGEKGREVDTAMTEMVSRGGGNWTAFNVAAGRKEWHHVVAREQAKQAKSIEARKALVVVADAKAMQVAVGSERWQELVDEARSFDLTFVTSDTILQVVLHIDMALIVPGSAIRIDEAGDRFSSPLPDFVPNTHPEEPSCPSPTEPGTSGNASKTLKRRATPSAVSRPSTPPSQALSREDTPPPRKPLKRRANLPMPSIIGIDDSSVIDGAPELTTEIPAPGPSAQPSTFADTTTPIPTRSSRLKRRAGTFASSIVNTQYIQSETIQQSGQEPALKKFKALFDASHPDRQSAQGTQSSMSYDDNIHRAQTLAQNVIQMQSSAAAGGGMDFEGARLDVVAEEEESGMAGTQDRGTKRKSGSDDGEVDDEMADPEETIPKRRAIEDVNAVQPSIRNHVASAATRSKPSFVPAKGSVSKSGAAPGKPDTDTAFLKAVASTKRGKKTEDEFDREFNKLKISKPDVHHGEQEKEWAVLDDFEEDRGIRGNFMLVMEMDIHSTENAGKQSRANAARDWQGRPNFKRFKKKPVLGSRVKVELVVHEESDYGVGSAYWKGNSQSQGVTAETSQPGMQKKSEEATQIAQPGRGRAFVIVDTDEDVREPAPRKSRAALTRVAKRVQNRQGSSRATQTLEKAQPLFIDSDENDEDEFRLLNYDDDHDEIIDDDDKDLNDNAMTLQSSMLKTQEPLARQTRSSKPAATKKGTKKAPVIVDDDSDDGATFKGFRGKKRGAR